MKKNLQFLKALPLIFLLSSCFNRDDYEGAVVVEYSDAEGKAKAVELFSENLIDDGRCLEIAVEVSKLGKEGRVTCFDKQDEPFFQVVCQPGEVFSRSGLVASSCDIKNFDVPANSPDAAVIPDLPYPLFAL